MWRWRASPASGPGGLLPYPVVSTASITPAASPGPGGMSCGAAPGVQVFLQGADHAPAILRRVGRAALELADQPRRLRPGARRSERDAPLEGELAQRALLAWCRGRCCGVGVVIGLGRRWARRAGGQALVRQDSRRDPQGRA